MTHKNANNEVFSLGGKNHVSLKQYISRESNEQACEKAMNKLGCRPQISLQEDMKCTARWYHKNGHLN